MKTCYPKTATSFCPSGMSAETFTPGDFILVSDTTFWARLIKAGQNLRFGDNTIAKWNHAALIITPQGDLIEAGAKGVRYVPLKKYENKNYFVIHTGQTNEDRHEIVDFAASVIEDSYGWITILCIALSFLTGSKFSFGFAGQYICSGLVARALERGTAIFKENTENICPALLARYFLEQ